MLYLATIALLLVPSMRSEASDPNEKCLDCHESSGEGEESEELLSFADGSTVSVSIDREVLAKSVHAKQICTDCHSTIAGYPHPTLEAKGIRAYRVAQSERCSKCHYAYYTRAIDSIHYEQLEKGNAEAPTCIDCHGGHEMADPDQPRVEVDRRCSRCHAAVAEAYERSVHGKALFGDGNTDVPVCTDCHGAHTIRDPRASDFRATSHTLCASCHADAERMARYGLSPDVVTSYLEDFHGKSNRLYSLGAGNAKKPMATCTDCHGMHDIRPAKEDAALMRERLVDTCRKCHETAGASFADAWLPHYEPTLASAPLVWIVRGAYRILIPFITLGLVLHILLHLFRVRSHR